MADNDIQLFEKIGEIPYAIIKNALSSNYFSLSSNDNIVKDSTVTLININYSTEKEEKFQSTQQYLFHGSQLHSWYPIIKNGLKVLSGTELQANGAAYGNGIYFSDNFLTSLSYSGRSTSTFGLNVVGVFQIADTIEKYKKAPGIFVIANDSILLLKYLVFTRKNDYGKNLDILTKYFTKEIPLNSKITTVGVCIIKNKRLNQEFKLLEKASYQINIINESKWETILNDNTKIIIKFANYPIKPPNLILDTGIIPPTLLDNDKNIQIPIIHPNVWSITTNLVMVLNQLKDIII